MTSPDKEQPNTSSDQGISKPIPFSQGSLQDYVDCPRRYQLRYLLHVAWPALEAEPALEHERHIQQGELFHRLIHQHQLGIPAQRLSQIAGSGNLGRWWVNYLEYASKPHNLGMPSLKRYPEVTLSAPIKDSRLVAKFDLVTISPENRATIHDWKTSLRRPSRSWLAARLQTRAYLYLLIKAGAHLNSTNMLLPDHVDMIYWYADFPEDPEHFTYSQEQYQQDEFYLNSLVDEITSRGEDGFPLTDHVERCQYCTYRSLCERGIRAGNLEKIIRDTEAESDTDLIIDLEQIAEIEF